MDRVRLGRALGYGTRHAAKTLAAVAEAATAPDPAPNQASTTPTPSAPGHSAARPGAPAGRMAASPRAVGQNAKGLAQTVWKPLASFTGVLWLQVTGTFFALIATTFGLAAWRLYSAAGPTGNPAPHSRLLVFAGVGLVFLYFAVSSFVRAHRRGR